MIKIVLLDEVPRGVNIMNGSFGMAVAGGDTPNPLPKARFVAQGLPSGLGKSGSNSCILHYTCVVDLLARGAVQQLCMSLEGFDATQANLQSDISLASDV